MYGLCLAARIRILRAMIAMVIMSLLIQSQVTEWWDLPPSAAPCKSPEGSKDSADQKSDHSHNAREEGAQRRRMLFSLTVVFKSLAASVGLCIRSHRDSIFAGWLHGVGRKKRKGKGKPVSAQEFWADFLGMWSFGSRQVPTPTVWSRPNIIGLSVCQLQRNSTGLEYEN